MAHAIRIHQSKKGLVPEIDLAAATLLPAMTTSSGQIKGLVGVGSGVAAREALCTKAEAHAGRGVSTPAVATPGTAFPHIGATATACAASLGLTWKQVNAVR